MPKEYTVAPFFPYFHLALQRPNISTENWGMQANCGCIPYLFRLYYYHVQDMEDVMISLKISNIKQFTSKLFLQETFDHFLVSEAVITTFNTFHIDGNLNGDFYTDVETEQLEDKQYSTWKMIRPICFQLIKGNKLPLAFKIVLRLTKENTTKVLEAANLIDQFDVDALYVNILYKNGQVSCVTGTALKQFTLDKTIEHVWDEMMKKFFIKHEIDFDME